MKTISIFITTVLITLFTANSNAGTDIPGNWSYGSGTTGTEIGPAYDVERPSDNLVTWRCAEAFSICSSIGPGGLHLNDVWGYVGSPTNPTKSAVKLPD